MKKIAINMYFILFTYSAIPKSTLTSKERKLSYLDCVRDYSVNLTTFIYRHSTCLTKRLYTGSGTSTIKQAKCAGK